MATKPDETRHTKSIGEQLGLMYKRWTLDCVVCIAHAVAKDFSQRLELYQKLGNEVANLLTNLQSQYGFDRDFPNSEIRMMLMKPIFGDSDGHGSRNDGSACQAYRIPVLAAAADFSENAQPTAFSMLRERIRSAIVPFKTHLVDLAGASLTQTEARTESVFTTAQSILKAPNVFAVFGINGSIDAKWPLESNDTQGAMLIEKITTQLADLPYGVISREMFVRMQRIAEKGYQSLRIILDNDIDDPKFDLDPLIAQLYAWGSDLGLIGGARPQQQMARPAVQVAAANVAPRRANI